MGMNTKTNSSTKNLFITHSPILLEIINSTGLKSSSNIYWTIIYKVPSNLSNLLEVGTTTEQMKIFDFSVVLQYKTDIEPVSFKLALKNKK